MNEYELNSFNIMVIGSGKKYFDEFEQSEAEGIRLKGFNFNLSEGFSQQKITQVMVLVGANVINGLGAHDIENIFDKVLMVKSKAKVNGQELQVNVSISEKVIIQNLDNVTEIKEPIKLFIEAKDNE